MTSRKAKPIIGSSQPLTFASVLPAMHVQHSIIFRSETHCAAIFVKQPVVFLVAAWAIAMVLTLMPRNTTVFVHRAARDPDESPPTSR